MSQGGLNGSGSGPSGGIATIDLDTGSITGSTVTISGGTTGLTTASSSSTVGNITGTLNVGHGGLGITTTPSNGQIPIGNGTNYTAATLTPGTGISITNGSGSISLAVTAATVLKINADSGSATPVGNAFLISGSSTGLTTTGSGSTIGLTGTLNLASGGTNASLTASNGGIFYSTATAAAILSATATANQVLLSGSNTTPAWSTATYPATVTVNQILYGSSSNVIGGITASNNGVLISGTGGIPSWLANGVTGQVLIATTSNPVSWGTLSSLSVTSITGTANQVLVNGGSGTPVNGAVTLTLPQSIAITSAVQFGSATIGTSDALTISASGQLTAINTCFIGASSVSSNTPVAQLYVISGTNSGSSATPLVVATASNPALCLAVGNFATATTANQGMTIQSAITGTSNQPLYLQPAGSGVGIGYEVAPPAGGLIVSGQVGIGLSSPSGQLNTAYFSSTGSSYGILASGTCNAIFSGFTIQSSIATTTTFSPSSSSSNMTTYFNGILVQPTFVTPTTQTWTGIFSGIYISPLFTGNAGTMSQVSALYFDGGGSLPAGAVTNGYGLYVSNPNFGSSKYCAVFLGTVGIGINNPNLNSQLNVGGSISSSNSSANVIGLYNNTIVTNTGSASGSNNYGFYNNPTISAGSTGTITNAEGANFSLTCSASGSGAVTNGYSLYVNTPTGATNNYCAYFAGGIGVGSNPSTTSGTIVTTPPSSNTVTTAFGSSLTSGTAKQNTTGYDIVLQIAVVVTASTTATITLGVGSSPTPTPNTAIQSFTVAASTVFSLNAYVPNNYYVLVSSTGTITVGSITVVAMAV